MIVSQERMVAAILGAIVLCGTTEAADTARRPVRESSAFGVLQTPTPEAVKAQAEQWLASIGKTDEATKKAVAAIWASDRPTLEKVADVLMLGDAEAKRLLDDARNPEAPAPTSVPAVVKDASKPAFYRANLALAYARALSARRVYEEALATLKLVRPEQVVDPAAYFFHRAVAEHALIQRSEAEESILRLLDDVTDAPERYRTVAALMQLDMLTWKEKDLGWIARKMDNIQRRLELVRGGKNTQKMQKEVLVRLDEMIKQAENQQKDQSSGSGSGSGGQCPPGGQPMPGQPGNNNQASSPQQDSFGGGSSGKGEIDPKKLKEIAEVWGKLPEKERAKTMLELTRNMPARYRDAIETYLKQISARSGAEK
jgi:tetratricopeptide (TPR) repeat protein